jgi:hypothetical protein
MNIEINPYSKGILQKVYNKYFYSLPKYYKIFYKNVNHPASTTKKILIYAAIGDMYLSPLEILMYHLLRSKGVEVHYLVYDDTIPLIELTTKNVVVNEGKVAFMSKLVKKTKANLTAAKVDFRFIEISAKIDTILTEPKTLEEVLSYKYEDVDFGDIVKGVMFRYYSSLSFGTDALEISKSFLKTSLTNYIQVKELNEKNNYDYVMFSHGIYCTWQPVLNYCRNNNVDFVCYDRAKIKNTCNFNLNIASPVWDITAAWIRLMDYKLNNQEFQKVNAYLKERELQKGDVFAYNFSEKEKDLSKLREKYNIKPKVKIITFFTNLIWDAANVSRDIAFKSPLECIQKTIDKYKDIDNVHLLFRSHPAEMIIGSNERYGSLIRDMYHVLPNNVSIIEPEDNINSFSVLELSDIGVVHTSTVGLEMAIEGKPVILISETHYRDKGFTYDTTSEENFFDTLHKLLNEPKPLQNQIELAKKYFYLMMFEYQHYVPMTLATNNTFNGYGVKDFYEIQQNKDAEINQIIDRMMLGEKFDDFIFRS